MLQDSFGVKREGRVASWVSTVRPNDLRFRRPPTTRKELRRWLVQFAKDHPRWGWKRAYQHRRREGHRVNKKRIQRLWRLETS